MSFGFGSGGFGQNNNNNQQSTFGGFGSNNNTTTPAFGAGATNTGFGSNTNTTGGGLFGATSGGFGNSGGFGSTNTTSAFGAAKPAFGAPTTNTGGGLFGSTNATTSTGTGFGGFGGASNNTGGGFGNSGGSLFGQKPATGAFGTNTSTTFGAAPSAPTSGTFGGFGAAATALGGNVGESPGTGTTPFSAFTEKEPNSSTNQQNAFQSISFMQPYQKFSPEELRLTDYAQGRRYGNGTAGATGAFGQSNFGGFGAANTTTSTGFGSATNNTTGGGLFGSNNTTTPAFGQANNTGGFGATNTGGLFGQKPATGLFGSAATTTPATGGLFGSSNTTGFGSAPATTGFGAAATTNPFGANNTTDKPGFSFGNNATNTTSGFGSNTTTAFGQSTGGGLFGSNNNNNQAAQPAAPAFGASNTGFGSSSGTGLFGQNTNQQAGGTGLFGGAAAAKPAGSLFGQPAATGGSSLFGGGAAAAPAASSGGLFGNTQNNAGSSLFGNNAAKSASGGLFGNTNTTNTNTTSSLFGGGFGNNNQTQQQNTGGGLFGNTQQAKPGGLFGNQSGGSSLFGNQQGAGSATNTQQQGLQQSSLFGNNSLMNQQQNQGLTASLNDSSALGTSMFANLASTSEVQNPGPLATPLSKLSSAKKPGILPMYKLNPTSSAGRFNTPGGSAKRGYGFSYSTYGTPNSVSSSTSGTPMNYGGSLLGSSFGGGRLTKSVSTSSLSRSFNSFGQDSILSPGAFSASPGSRFNSTGSMKKLVINRGIRTDLFSPPAKENTPSTPNSQQSILKKRVSFDTAGPSTNGKPGNSPLKQVESSSAPATEDSGHSRSSSRTNGNSASSASSDPEMQQVKGNELAIVHEEDAATSTGPNTRVNSEVPADMEPGRYWTSPSREEIESMNRMQRQKVSNFIVGREGVGKVIFEVPVDLSNINFDDFFGKIVDLEVRSATVYPDSSTKPPVGKGLNVPSRIELYNSYPRTTSRRKLSEAERESRIRKHKERLRRVVDTEYVDYNDTTGTWIFRVEHFTTYGLEYDDETDGELDQSVLSAPPDTPTPQSRTPKASEHSFVSQSDMNDSDPEDTFDFKKKKIVLPGAFGNQEAFYQDDAEMEDDVHQQSFLDDRSMDSRSENGVDEPMDQDNFDNDDRELVRIEDGITGAFPHLADTMEHDDDPKENMLINFDTPAAVQRARLRSKAASPAKDIIMADDDWMTMLQRTVSPRKQDRAQLKFLAQSVIAGADEDEDDTPVKTRVVSDNRGFATSLDIMQSLYGQANKSPMKAKKKAKGFEWPYSKAKGQDADDMDDNDTACLESFKPHWGPDGTLVYASSAGQKSFHRSAQRVRERDGLIVIRKGGVSSERRDIRFANFSNESSADHLRKQQSLTQIKMDGDAPYAEMTKTFRFIDFFDDKNARDPVAVHEKLVWELASVLFDRLDIPLEVSNVQNVEVKLRKDELSSFWEKLVEASASRDVAMAKSHEEKAIASLSGHKVAEACNHLLHGKDYHLATLIALIGQNESTRKDIRAQLNDWRKSKMLSEFSQPVRALYELLAGNVSVCDGTKAGTPIEDRIESFLISKRFGLDWRQAFGLRLWYAIAANDGIEAAVRKFEDDIQQDKEASKPQVWYVEQGITPIWNDKDLEAREDLLWGLLKLYADPNADLEAVIRPENLQLSPVDVRLSWQLSRALTASGQITYGSYASEKADQLTISFAAQLTAEGSWLDAIFALLHLTDSSSRTTAIQAHLAQHAERIDSEDSPSFQTLLNRYQIPASWIWEAKALYCRSVLQDARGEVECLIRAKDFDEAHRTFSKEVAPRTVIECDWETLRKLLAGFHGKETVIKEWHTGGQLYSDYLDLLDAQKKGVSTINDKLIARLLAALPAKADDSRDISFIETVAIQEIAGVVSKIVIELGKGGQIKNVPKVLGLPLTEDGYLKYTIDLSLEYYRTMMTVG